MTQQAGRQHPAVIEDQAVPRAEELGQVVEMPVLHSAGLLVQQHEPGAVPALQRGLGDQFLGQVIVKIRGLHLARFQLSQRISVPG